MRRMIRKGRKEMTEDIFIRLIFKATSKVKRLAGMIRKGARHALRPARQNRSTAELADLWVLWMAESWRDEWIDDPGKWLGEDFSKRERKLLEWFEDHPEDAFNMSCTV